MKLNYSSANILFELRQSLKLVIPLIGTQLFYAVGNIGSTIILAHVGAGELATNALVWGIYITLILFVMGMLSSVCALVAQKHGARDKQGINIIINQGFLLVIVLAIPISLIIWLIPTIVSWTNQDPIIIKLAKPYCHSLILSILPLNLLLIIEQILIGMSAVRTVFLLSGLKVILELFFVYVLVFGKYGFSKLGLVGIGYGISIAASCTLIIAICSIYYSKKWDGYCWRLSLSQCSFKRFWGLIKQGFPLGAMCCIELSLFSTAAFMMSHFGIFLLAAHQFVYQCLVFTLTIIFGVLQATTVRIGNEVGNNNFSQLKLIVWINLGIGFCVILPLVMLYFFFPQYLAAFGFGTQALENQLVIKYIKKFLPLIAVLQIVEGVRLIVIGALRGLNDTKVIMYNSILAFWIVAFPISYLLAFVLHWGGAGIWLGLLMGIMVGAIVSLTRFNFLVNNSS